MSVSYTHLDVYKRQVRHHLTDQGVDAGAQTGSHNARDQGDKDIAEGLEQLLDLALLDVYKRQHSGRRVGKDHPAVRLRRPDRAGKAAAVSSIKFFADMQ